MTLQESAGLASFLPDDVKRNAIRRWSEDHKATGEECPAGSSELLDYADFADLGKLLHILQSQFVKVNDQIVQQTADALIRLAPTRNRVCHTRPLEPDDFAALYDLARDVSHKFKAYECNGINATLQRLQSSPSYVLSLVIPSFWSVDFSTIPHNLPLPEFDDTWIFGTREGP